MSRSYWSSRLPQELTDRIIDFLWEDRSALRACSLVCRTWRSASQKHLLSILTFVSQRSDVFARLRRLKTQARLALHVRTLYFIEAHTTPWDELALAVHDYLPALRLHKATFVVRRPHDVFTLAFIAPQWGTHLLHLTLRGVSFPTAAAFAATLAPLVSLRVLELDPLLVSAADATLETPNPPFTGRCDVRMSLVGLHSMEALLPWMRRGRERENVVLRALSATIQDTSALAFRETMSVHYHDLWMLRLTVICGEETWHEVREGIQLCRSLRVLVFDPQGDFPEQSYIQHIAATVSSTTRSCRVVINTTNMPVYAPMALASIDWNVLEEAMVYSSGELHIVVSAPRDWGTDQEEYARAILESLMPRLTAARRLSFVPDRKIL